MAQPVQYQPDDRAISPISKLQRRWAHGGFAITAQLPPLNTGAEAFVEQIASGVRLCDAVLTADAPGGAIGLSSVALAVLLRRVGVEPVMQMSGRDRNRLALQSDMLGLGVLGIPNLLIDTRPLIRASLGQNPDARLVIDLHGAALLAAAAGTRDDARFTSGAIIKTPPVYYLGALIALEDSLSASELSAAQFLVTPPLHDTYHRIDTLASYCAARADLLRTRPLLVSLPLTSCSRDRDDLDVCAQSMVEEIETLKTCKGVRGCNMVLERCADLDIVERVALALALSPENAGIPDILE
jgi:hypothetical protein